MWLAESLLTKIPANIGQSLKQSAEIGSCFVKLLSADCIASGIIDYEKKQEEYI